MLTTVTTLAIVVPSGATDAIDGSAPATALPENGLLGEGITAAVQDGSLAAAAAPDGSVKMYAVERFGDRLEVTDYEADSTGEAIAIAKNLSQKASTVSLDVDVPVEAVGTFDQRRGEQWALDRVSFEAAWGMSNGSGVKVAVLDTGVRSDHEDLAGSVLTGADMVGGGNPNTDPLGHGTHVAGIIAAHANNGPGIAGAAPGAKILPVRVLDANGAGYMSDVAQGIIWSVDHGARVVSMSLGGSQPAEGVRSAIQYANSKKAVVAVAAGNGALSGNPVTYPAAYPEALTVGSVDSNLGRSVFSGYQPYVDLAAPGGAILSTYSSSPSSYALASGTSMATPQVAAAAAIVIGAHPGLGASTVTSYLTSTAIDLGPSGKDSEYGFGLVNPNAAVRRYTAPANAGTRGAGYWVATASGQVRNFGYAGHYGDLRNAPIAAPVVASARTKSGKGYWLTTANGQVYAYGDAHNYGDLAGHALNAPIVGMAALRSGLGYYLLGSDGGVFSFGAARFHGSTGGMRLNAPVLDMAVTRTGGGYWFVAADGGVFTFGDAVFRGSTGGIHLNQPVRSITTTPSGTGYWLVARDGGIFTFGAPYHGSLPSIGVQTTAGQRIRALSDGTGYYILTADGGVFSFGTARSYGSAAPLASSGAANDMMVLG